MKISACKRDSEQVLQCWICDWREHLQYQYKCVCFSSYLWSQACPHYNNVAVHSNCHIFHGNDCFFWVLANRMWSATWSRDLANKVCNSIWHGTCFLRWIFVQCQRRLTLLLFETYLRKSLDPVFSHPYCKIAECLYILIRCSCCCDWVSHNERWKHILMSTGKSASNR